MHALVAALSFTRHPLPDELSPVAIRIAENALSLGISNSCDLRNAKEVSILIYGALE